MIPIVVYGCGGHGRETALLIETLIAHGKPWQLVGYLDDDNSRHRSIVGGHAVLGGMDVLTRHSGEFLVALGVGSPTIKQDIVARAMPYAREFPVLVHPSVTLNARVNVQQGTQLHEGTIITVDVAIGAFVIVNRRVDISHDCHVGDYATLAPAVTLTGATYIGTAADLGARVTTIPGVRVGANSVVGAGAVVTRDIPDNVTAVGVPARVVKTQRPSSEPSHLELAS